jgi:hypothetical protein
MKLQLLHGFEGEAALVASVLIDMLLRHGYRLLMSRSARNAGTSVNFSEMHLKTMRSREILVATLFPT